MAEGIPFGSAVYFSVVTLATVGYGDVVVVSNLGRFFVSCLICVSFIWLPYEINSLTQMLSLRSRYLTTFTPRADKYVFLVRGRGGREGGWEGWPCSNFMFDGRLNFILPFPHYSRRPNVLLIGHLDAAKLSTFLGEFFHPDRRTEGSQAAFYHVRIMILIDFLVNFACFMSGLLCAPSSLKLDRQMTHAHSLPRHTQNKIRWSSFPTKSRTTR